LGTIINNTCLYYNQLSLSLLSEGNELKFKSANFVLEKLYDKRFSVDHANQIFIDLSSTRKHKIIRALYLGDLCINRMWEEAGHICWDFLSSHYYKELEYQKLYGLKPIRDYTLSYMIFFDPWRIKWMCNCQYFSLYEENDPCIHIITIKLMNILKDYIPYFIYAYRFLLPTRCYNQFMIQFGHKPIN
jgi:hypothetical protein